MHLGVVGQLLLLPGRWVGVVLVLHSRTQDAIISLLKILSSLDLYEGTLYFCCCCLGGEEGGALVLAFSGYERRGCTHRQDAGT